MKVLVVLFALAAVASAWPTTYYETPAMKYYGEPEVFVSHIDKPATSYASSGYRLITAGQYDLPYNHHYEHEYSGYSADAFPRFNWMKY